MKGWLRGALLGGAVLAAIALGVGCGSDQSTTASSSAGDGASSSEKAAFIKQADAVCLAEREKTMARVGVYEKRHSSENLPEAVMVKKAIKAAVLETIEGKSRR